MGPRWEGVRGDPRLWTSSELQVLATLTILPEWGTIRWLLGVRPYLATVRAGGGHRGLGQVGSQ